MRMVRQHYASRDRGRVPHRRRSWDRLLGCADRGDGEQGRRASNLSGDLNPGQIIAGVQVRKALDELVGVGFLRAYRFEGDVVKVLRT